MLTADAIDRTPTPERLRDTVAPAEGTTLLERLAILLHYWRTVLGLPLAAGVLATFAWLVLPPRYTAAVVFVPEAPSQSRLPTGLAGLAGQFGISLGSEASYSPQFYARLVHSRQILERVLLTRYQSPAQSLMSRDSATLLQIIATGGRDRPDSIHRALKKLRRRVSVQVDARTRTLTLEVTTSDPVLSATVATKFVTYLNLFNAQTRQSQARQRRLFVEERVQEAEFQLRHAENTLRTFYESNRSWQRAPQLVFEEGRLRRQVDIQQEVYLTLRREYETARIEEVNNTPVITVVDPAVAPEKPSSPRLPVYLGLALVIGLCSGILWAFTFAYVQRVRRNSPRAYERFRESYRRA